MADADLWNKFQIFDGQCMLDRTRFRRGADLNADVGRFFTWINNLHANPQANGIPVGRAADVQNLLQAFFPVWAGPGQAPPRYEDVRVLNPNDAAVPVGNPIQVPFGNNHNISINDGPSALGYIFSIAEPPANVQINRTWREYVVPLLAIYARCVYLAYIVRPGAQNPNTWESGASNVPWMVGAMYFTDTGGDLQVLLGSTYIPGRETAAAAAMTRARRFLMNTWRANNVLTPPLQACQPQRGLPPAGQILAPILAENVCRGILNILQGLSLASGHGTPSNPPASWITVPVAAADTTFAAAVLSLKATWANTNPASLIEALPLADVARFRPLQPQLQAALMAVYRLRWNPAGYNRNNPAVDLAFRAVFDIYFAPHMFPAVLPAGTAPDLAQPEMSGQIAGYDVQKLAVFTALYFPARTAILDMLDRFHGWVQADDRNLGPGGAHVQRYGRCCETYPVSKLMPVYTPERVLQAQLNPTQINGFSFQTRLFANTAYADALGIHFDPPTLNSLHENMQNGLYRRPCRNCQTLLPLFDTPMNDNYYAHLNQLYPNAPQNVPVD